MFVFIIPRVPVKMRNSLRDELWEISKKSLLNQTSKNWKAIIIGDVSDEYLDTEFFITLNYDQYSKQEKLYKALEYIKNHSDINPKYLIRFDDDDFFSSNALSLFELLDRPYDCFFDKYHTYVDLVYLKISYKKNSWIPNTAVHKYEHAINECGPSKTPLIVQDHSAYWHIYYRDKDIYLTSLKQSLYYRVLTPFSITAGMNPTGNIDWNKYLVYLKGYGPWINYVSKNPFYNDLLEISNDFFKTKPVLNYVHWFFNKLKHIRKIFF